MTLRFPVKLRKSLNNRAGLRVRSRAAFTASPHSTVVRPPAWPCLRGWRGWQDKVDAVQEHENSAVSRKLL